MPRSKEEKIFRSVLQKAPYGAVLIDRDGSYLYVNEEFTTITGYTLKDVPTGRSWFERAYPDPQGRAEAIDAWRGDSEKTGASQTFTITCKDGRPKVVEFRPNPLGDGRYILMLSDVTERESARKTLQEARDELERRVEERTMELSDLNRGLEREVGVRRDAEKALREKEERLSAVVEAFEGLIYVCSEDYRVEFMNERFIKRTGYDPVGEFCYEAIHRRNSVCPWCVNDRVFAGETVRWELKSPMDDHWYYVINTPIYHAGGAISKYSVLFDITERKRAEEKAAELNRNLEQKVAELGSANRELEIFSYSISHDLKTSVVGIEGLSRVLLERYGSPLETKARHYLEMIQKSSQEMTEFLNDLVAFFSMGRKALRLVALDMEKMARDVSEQLSAFQREQEVEVFIAPLPAGYGDKTMIKQVLANLVSNAFKYSRNQKKAVIQIGGWTEEARNVYFVKDNGVGFSAEQAERAFEVFERLHSADQFEGTGIGLATVKRVVNRHGGEVWARSAPGRGATFYFTLPRPGNG
jgi:PAS domain S-box-containing protein